MKTESQIEELNLRVQKARAIATAYETVATAYTTAAATATTATDATTLAAIATAATAIAATAAYAANAASITPRHARDVLASLQATINKAAPEGCKQGDHRPKGTP